MGPGSFGLAENEAADNLARQAANHNTSLSSFVPYPFCSLSSIVIYILCSLYLIKGVFFKAEAKMTDTNRVEIPLRIFKHREEHVPIFREVPKSLPIINRYTFLFLTNHSSFQKHLNRISKKNSPTCSWDQLFTSLHYILECSITSRYHVKKHPF